MIESKKYFLLKKINQYKEKLQHYKRFEGKAVIEYEKKWRYLRKKYEKIYLYGIQFVSFGETAPRLFALMEDVRKERKKAFHVVLPTFTETYIGKIYNRRLFDVFGKKIYFIRDDNIGFWIYVFLFHAKEINTEQFDKYVPRELGSVGIKLGVPLLPFSASEIQEGEKKLKAMGVNREFICIHARESNVKKVNFGKVAGREGRCRNCDIDTFIKTAEFFQTLNIQSVRFGKYETKKCDSKAVIDYANKFYDEFMDFYLFSKCKFFIGAASGPASICGYWGRPVLMVNLLNLEYGLEYGPDTQYDMYIPKKLYSKKKKRYLNLYETLDTTDECMITASRYEVRGIVIEDNTEEEILGAALEMNSRLDGTWQETEEEQEIYRKYWMIMDGWRRKHKYVKQRKQANWDGYTMVFFKPSYSYLKRNLYLLDVDISLLK